MLRESLSRIEASCRHHGSPSWPLAWPCPCRPVWKACPIPAGVRSHPSSFLALTTALGSADTRWRWRRSAGTPAPGLSGGCACRTASPPHDTCGRVFALIDPEPWDAGLAQWVQTLHGKTAGRAHDRCQGRLALHTARVTMDVCGGQKELAWPLRSQQAAYGRTVKANPPPLRAAPEETFRAARAAQCKGCLHTAHRTVAVAPDASRSVEVGRGRPGEARARPVQFPAGGGGMVGGRPR